MDGESCLKKLQYVGVLSFATIGLDHRPQVRCISAIHYAPDALYFFTARGKDFCKELLRDGHVQILAYTRYKEMIRVSAKAEPVPEANQQQWIDLIFREQPYLANIYPGDTRKIGIVFRIGSMSIEYFNLGVNPIFRESYVMGNEAAAPKGYVITQDCIGCGKCIDVCPQRAIDPGRPSVIHQEHCLHCGNCVDICPVRAIKSRALPD